MKKISKMTYDNFIIDGEVNEQLPLYTNNLKYLYPLNGHMGSIFPDCQIGIVNNSLSMIQGTDSMIINKANIFVSDNCLSFNGSSELQLDASLFNDYGFEFEIKFKPSDITNTATSLMTCKIDTTNEMNIVIDYSSRCIYADINKKMYTVADFNSYYSLTDFGAINKNNWYTLKLVKEGNIVTVHLNDILTRSLVFREEFSCNNVSIGKNFKGLIEYIKISKSKQSTDEDYRIIDNIFSNSFTVGFYWKPDPVEIYNIADIGVINFYSNMNNIIVSYNNEEIGSAFVTEANEYYISLAYNKIDKKVCIYIYNMTYHRLELKLEKEMALTTNFITIKNDICLYDLAIYNAYLEEKFVLRNITRKFSMDKYGNLNYNINEEEIGFRVDDYFYLPLSQDLNSLCNTISKEDESLHCEQSVKSGLYEADDIINLMDLDLVTKVTASWDNNLHHNAYEVPNWSTGYNANVTNPQIGYHAKWSAEYSSTDSITLKFINCNSDYNLSNRLMHVTRYITPNELWNKCKIGDKILITFEGKADMPCDIKMGIYRSLKSTGSYSFVNDLKVIKIQNSSWDEYTYEITIDSDWNLTKNANLYIYGNVTDGATSYLRNIHLIRNGNKAPIDVITDQEKRNINIPFKDEIGLTSPNFSIFYNTKLISQNNNIINKMKDISWGVKDNKLFIETPSKTSNSGVCDIPLDEWMTVGLNIASNKVILYLGTRQGIYTHTVESISLIANNIGDLELDSNNCSLYKDLFISNQSLTKEKFEKYHRTKMSYYNNSMIFKSIIEESNI